MLDVLDNTENVNDVKKNKVPVKKDARAEAKSKLEYLRDQHRQKVKGLFKFYEVPGGELEFDFLEFKGDPVQSYKLKDGEIYEIPLGVARHLNKNGWYPVHAYEMDALGKPAIKVGQKVRRFGFQSLEFVDEVDLGEVGNVLTAQQM